MSTNDSSTSPSHRLEQQAKFENIPNTYRNLAAGSSRPRLPTIKPSTPDADPDHMHHSSSTRAVLEQRQPPREIEPSEVQERLSAIKDGKIKVDKPCTWKTDVCCEWYSKDSENPLGKTDARVFYCWGCMAITGCVWVDGLPDSDSDDEECGEPRYYGHRFKGRTRDGRRWTVAEFWRDENDRTYGFSCVCNSDNAELGD